MLRAPLPNWLIHVHGAFCSMWVLLLVAHTSTVTAARVAVHGGLGLLGVGLACMMVPLGILAAADMMRRAVANGDLRDLGIACRKGGSRRLSVPDRRRRCFAYILKW